MWLLKLGNVLLNLDVLAPSVQLRIAGNTSSKSFIGVLLFLGYLGIALWTSLALYADYLNTENPRIANDQRFSSEYPRFNLSESYNLPIIIGAYESRDYTKPEDLEKFLTIKLWSINYELVHDTGNLTDDITEIPFIHCKLLIASGELSLQSLSGIPKAFLDIIPEYGMCANTTGVDVTVVGSNVGELLQTVELSISPCSLPGGIGCKPAAEVNKMWIQTLTPKIGLDLSSQADPVKLSFSPDNLFPLNVNNMQLFKYEMVRNQIIDSFGFFTKDKLRSSFSTAIEKPIFWIPRNPDLVFAEKQDLFYMKTAPYVTIDWASGTKFNLIRRNYQGVIDLVSNIGGLNSIIWVLVSGLYFVLHPIFQRQTLVQMVFGLQKEGFFNKTNSLASKLRAAAGVLKLGKSQSTAEQGQSQHITSNSTYTIVSKEVFDEAADCVEKELDVVNICKKLNELQFLVELLLKREQTELIPLATLCRHSRRKGAKSGRAARLGLDQKEQNKSLAQINTSAPEMAGGIVASQPRQPTTQFGFEVELASEVPRPPTGMKDSEVHIEPRLKGGVLTSVLEGLEEEFNKLIRSEMLGDPTETKESESSPAVAKEALKARLQRNSTKSAFEPTENQGLERDCLSSREPFASATKVDDATKNPQNQVSGRQQLADETSPIPNRIRSKSKPVKVVLRPNSNNSSNPIPQRLSSKGQKTPKTASKNEP